MIVIAYDLLADIIPLIVATGITTEIHGEFIADATLNTITIAHTSGPNPDHTFSGGNPAFQKPAITHPGFQVTIRHASEHTAHEWWDAIINALDGKVNYAVNGRTYLIIQQQGDVADLGRDSNRRHLMTLNFTTSVINAR